jgi:enediyne polyketide synthase
LPVAVESVTVHGAASGEIVVAARERSRAGDTFVWDLEARTADGRLCERWHGLELRRIGPSPKLERWPLPLLAAHIERRLAELAVEPVAVALRARQGLREPNTAAETIAEAAGTAAPVLRRADGKPEVNGSEVSAAHVGGYTLAVAGSVPLACDVEAAEPRTEQLWRDLLGGPRFELASRLCLEADEDLDASAARVWAAAECVRKAGRSSRDPLALEGASPDGWTLLRAGRSPVATYVVRVADDEPPLAFAFLVEGDR